MLTAQRQAPTRKRGPPPSSFRGNVPTIATRSSSLGDAGAARPRTADGATTSAAARNELAPSQPTVPSLRNVASTGRLAGEAAVAAGAAEEDASDVVVERGSLEGQGVPPPPPPPPSRVLLRPCDAAHAYSREPTPVPTSNWRQRSAYYLRLEASRDHAGAASFLPVPEPADHPVGGGRHAEANGSVGGSPGVGGGGGGGSHAARSGSVRKMGSFRLRLFGRSRDDVSLVAETAPASGLTDEGETAWEAERRAEDEELERRRKKHQQQRRALALLDEFNLERPDRATAAAAKLKSAHRNGAGSSQSSSSDSQSRARLRSPEDASCVLRHASASASSSRANPVDALHAARSSGERAPPNRGRSASLLSGASSSNDSGSGATTSSGGGAARVHWLDGVVRGENSYAPAAAAPASAAAPAAAEASAAAVEQRSRSSSITSFIFATPPSSQGDHGVVDASVLASIPVPRATPPRRRAPLRELFGAQALAPPPPPKTTTTREPREEAGKPPRWSETVHVEGFVHPFASAAYRDGGRDLDGRVEEVEQQPQHEEQHEEGQEGKRGQEVASLATASAKSAEADHLSALVDRCCEELAAEAHEAKQGYDHAVLHESTPRHRVPRSWVGWVRAYARGDLDVNAPPKPRSAPLVRRAVPRGSPGSLYSTPRNSPGPRRFLQSPSSPLGPASPSASPSSGLLVPASPSSALAGRRPSPNRGIGLLLGGDTAVGTDSQAHSPGRGRVVDDLGGAFEVEVMRLERFDDEEEMLREAEETAAVGGEGDLRAPRPTSEAQRQDEVDEYLGALSASALGADHDEQVIDVWRPRLHAIVERLRSQLDVGYAALQLLSDDRCVVLAASRATRADGGAVSGLEPSVPLAPPPPRHTPGSDFLPAGFPATTPTTTTSATVTGEAAILSRDASLDAHALLSREGEPLVLGDVERDWRFCERDASSPSSSSQLRSYGGASVLSPQSGLPLGTVCFSDARPIEAPRRREAARAALVVAARAAAEQLERVRRSHVVRRLSESEDSLAAWRTRWQASFPRGESTTRGRAPSGSSSSASPFGPAALLEPRHASTSGLAQRRGLVSPQALTLSSASGTATQSARAHSHALEALQDALQSLTLGINVELAYVARLDDDDVGATRCQVVARHDEGLLETGELRPSRDLHAALARARWGGCVANDAMTVRRLLGVDALTDRGRDAVTSAARRGVHGHGADAAAAAVAAMALMAATTSNAAAAAACAFESAVVVGIPTSASTRPTTTRRSAEDEGGARTNDAGCGASPSCSRPPAPRACVVVATRNAHLDLASVEKRLRLVRFAAALGDLLGDDGLEAAALAVRARPGAAGRNGQSDLDMDHVATTPTAAELPASSTASKPSTPLPGAPSLRTPVTAAPRRLRSAVALRSAGATSSGGGERGSGAAMPPPTSPPPTTPLPLLPVLPTPTDG